MQGPIRIRFKLLLLLLLLSQRLYAHVTWSKYTIKRSGIYRCRPQYVVWNVWVINASGEQSCEVTASHAERMQLLKQGTETWTRFVVQQNLHARNRYLYLIPWRAGILISKLSVTTSDFIHKLVHELAYFEKLTVPQLVKKKNSPPFKKSEDLSQQGCKIHSGIHFVRWHRIFSA